MKASLENNKESKNKIVQRVQQKLDSVGKAVITNNRWTTAAQRKLRSDIEGSGNTTNPIQQKNNTGPPRQIKIRYRKSIRV